MSVNVNSYKLSIDGLTINYTCNLESTTLVCDPKATCELFQSAGMIEGFDIDVNGEPVIYYTENIWCRPATAYCLWFEFVKTFPFIPRHAEILIEHLIDTRAFKKTHEKIDSMLSLIRHS